jgi:predicted adenine nucleotide alpha hydrolase (AANH) superfamily ATPase
MWDDPWLEIGADSKRQFQSENIPAKRRASEFAPGDVFAVPPAVNPALWLRAVSGREGERCIFCWRIRLRKTAQLAVRRGFDGYTSSLLYSRHQNHDAIRGLGASIAEEAGLAFVYEDFRASWQEGIRLSRDWGIYRQQYCGCLFSEYDRYSRDFIRQ